MTNYGYIYAPTPEEVQLCSDYIQLGTSNVFTAQCTGTLLLFFNDDYPPDDAGTYTVVVSPLISTSVVVQAINSLGTVVGTVSNGVTYTCTASGFCSRGGGTCSPYPDCYTDPNGNARNGSMVGCAGGRGVPCNTPCPLDICYSLVGKIVPQ